MKSTAYHNWPMKSTAYHNWPMKSTAYHNWPMKSTDYSLMADLKNTIQTLEKIRKTSESIF